MTRNWKDIINFKKKDKSKKELDTEKELSFKTMHSVQLTIEIDGVGELLYNVFGRFYEHPEDLAGNIMKRQTIIINNILYNTRYIKSIKDYEVLSSIEVGFSCEHCGPFSAYLFKSHVDMCDLKIIKPNVYEYVCTDNFILE